MRPTFKAFQQTETPSPRQGESWNGGRTLDIESIYPLPKPPPARGSEFQAGFTLVEMVVVITIVGILAAGAALFIRNPTQAFIDSENRANLTDRADTALRRMASDIRNALPNSVRATTNGVNSFIEFVPVKAAGRYRASAGSSLADNPLDFDHVASAADPETFDVLGAKVNVDAGDQLVIYNLGIVGSDVYENTANSNRHTLETTGLLGTLSFSGGTFPLASPSSRFFVVSTPVSYVCDMANNVLLRYSGYAIQANQPTTVAALNGLGTARILANGLTTCQVNYVPGVLQRSGVITINLGFTQDVATVTLMHQVNVVNSP